MLTNNKQHNIYFIGIKGVGMTMLAQFLQQSGQIVSGSDISETFLTDEVLAGLKIPVKSPFSVANIPANLDVVIHSTAYTRINNEELKYLIKRHKKDKSFSIYSYPQALAELFNAKKGIAVCGSHGKTTVTAWLGYVLSQADYQPNVLVGSSVPQFGGSGLVGNSDLFIAEVDEYQNKLAYFQPWGVLLNNIDFDHPDYFKDKQSYTQVFLDFIEKIPHSGFLILNENDPHTALIKKQSLAKTISYGISTDSTADIKADYLASKLEIKNGRQYFQVNDLGQFEIALVGEHNVANALAVIATCFHLGLDETKIKKYLASFTGTTRRMEKKGYSNDALIIDDYAHHPTEIKASLASIKASWPDKKIILVFHPHTYTRTKSLFADFVSSFTLADELFILDIYGSAREKQGGTSSAKLAQAIREYNKKEGLSQLVHSKHQMDEIYQALKTSLDQDQVLLLMGAGDVFRLADKLLNKNN